MATEVWNILSDIPAHAKATLPFGEITSADIGLSVSRMEWAEIYPYLHSEIFERWTDFLVFLVTGRLPV